jgi:hypothetical protein
MCLLAVAANLILFTTRFGYHALYSGRGNLSANFNESFSIDLTRADPTTFYVPRLLLLPNQMSGFVTFSSQNQLTGWQKVSLKI